MKTRNLFVLLFIVGLAAGAQAANVRWDYQWNASLLPEDFFAGDVLSATQYLPGSSEVIRAVDNGIYTCETTSDGSVNANCSYKNTEGMFDASLPATFEFRFKNESSAGYYTNCFFIKQAGVGYLGFKFAWNFEMNPYERNDWMKLDTDEQGYATCRVLTNVSNGQITSIDLYSINSEGNWEYGRTSYMTSQPAYTQDEFIFGDIGGNWSGKWYEDYMYWTNQAATMDPISDSYIDMADLNGDGTVDVLDLAVFASEWLQ